MAGNRRSDYDDGLRTLRCWRLKVTYSVVWAADLIRPLVIALHCIKKWSPALVTRKDGTVRHVQYTVAYAPNDLNMTFCGTPSLQACMIKNPF